MLAYNFNNVPDDEVIQRTAQALRTSTNIEVDVVQSRADALEWLIGRIPECAEIFPGTSVTLEQIGFVDYLGRSPELYRNLRQVTANEPGAEKRAELRRHTPLVDHFIGSVHAVAETG